MFAAIGFDGDGWVGFVAGVIADVGVAVIVAAVVDGASILSMALLLKLTRLTKMVLLAEFPSNNRKNNFNFKKVTKK